MAPRKTTTKKKTSIGKNKTLETYAKKTKRPQSRDYEKDTKRLAKAPGLRVSDTTGRVYYESRPNRSDTEEERTWHGGGRKLSDLLDNLTKKRPKKTDNKPSGREGLPSGFRYGKLITPPHLRSKKKLSETELLKVAKEYGRKISDAKIENGILLDDCGNCISHTLGSKTSVKYPPVQYRAAKVVLHNHPDQGARDYYTPQSGTDIMNLFLTVTPKHHMVVTHGRWYNWDISSPGEPFTGKSGAPRFPDEIRRKVNTIIKNAEYELIKKFCKAHGIGCKFSRDGITWQRLYSDMPHEMMHRLSKRVFTMYIQNRWQVMVPAQEKEIRTLLNSTGGRRFKFTKGEL